MTLLEKLNAKYLRHPHYDSESGTNPRKPNLKIGQGHFVLRHYAGDVRKINFVT